MITDYTISGNEIRSIAQRKNITVPDKLSEKTTNDL